MYQRVTDAAQIHRTAGRKGAGRGGGSGIGGGHPAYESSALAGTAADAPRRERRCALRPPSHSCRAAGAAARASERRARPEVGPAFAVMLESRTSRDGSLELDGGAGALELVLGLLGRSLVDTLENGLGSAVDEVLGLLEAEARERADLLDDLDLLLTGGDENDVESVLLLRLGGGSAASAGRGGGGDGGSSGDLEGLLELLHELGELDEGHFLESVKELVGAELRHGGFLPVTCREWLIDESSGRQWASALVATLGDVGGCLGGRSLRGGALLLALLTQSLDHTGRLRQRSNEEVGGLGEGALHGARKLGQQNLAGLEVRELRDLLGAQGLAVEDASLDHEEGVCLGEVTQTLGRLDRVTGDEGDGRRALEVAVEGRDTGLLGGALRERVLDHGVGGVFPDRAAQLRELGHGQTAVLGENGRTGLTELVRDLGNGCALLGVCHLGLLPLRGAARRRGPEGLHEKSPGAGRSGLAATYTRYAVRLSVLRWLPASCGTFESSWSPTPSNLRSLVVDQSTGSIRPDQIRFGAPRRVLCRYRGSSG